MYFVTIVVVSVLLCVIIVIGRVTLYRMRSCSHGDDNDDSVTTPGKDKDATLEMPCKTATTKFDGNSGLHEECTAAINTKGENILSNTLAGLPLSPLMTKEVRIACN